LIRYLTLGELLELHRRKLGSETSSVITEWSCFYCSLLTSLNGSNTSSIALSSNSR